MRTPMNRTETIQRALELCPVVWGRDDYIDGPSKAYPLRYDPTMKRYPWTTRQPDNTGVCNIDAEGKVIVEWMRWLDSVGNDSAVENGEMAAFTKEYTAAIPSTDHADWLLTLAEAICEVMG
jgi:hypothetical protein